MAGPCEIMSRVGEHSYKIRMGNDILKDTPAIFLKRYEPDIFSTQPTELHYHRRTVIDWEATPQEAIVEKILDHRRNAKGEYMFLTQWQGYDIHDATWEPVSSFIHRYNAEMARYCQEKGTS